MSSRDSEGTRLRRSLGLFPTTVMGIGVILGAGIYALVGKAAGLAGNAVWLSFLGAALFAGATGLSYAELSSFIPRAGGSYHYARRAFGDTVAFVTTWLFLSGLGIVSAAVALGFGGYFETLVGGGHVVPAVGVIAGSTALLVRGIRESAWFAAFCTVLEVLGLAAVIALGVPYLGEVDLLEVTHGWGGVASAAALIFFAYIGFEEIVQLAEETRDPTRNIPRAIVLSLAATTVVYILVAIAAVSIVGWERLSASDAPLADVIAAGFGPRGSAAIGVIALFSTANTVLVLLLSGSRMLFGMADHGAMPRLLARVHRRWRSPWVATLLVASVATLFAVSLRRIELVANLGNFAFLVAFGVVNCAVIVLRFREPETPRPFRVPGRIGRVPLVPLLAVGSALVLMVRLGALAALLGLGIALSGLLVHLSRRAASRG